jgi:hypothetical protein
MIRHIAPILLFFLSLTLNAQTVDNLAAVRIIHVGNMGKSDRAASFRSLLGKELAAGGFIVTESENADTTISGILTVDVHEEASGAQTGAAISITPQGNRLYARCTASLNNRDGAILWKWEGESGSKRFWDKIALEPIGNLAFQLARALEKDYRKAVKKTAGSRQSIVGSE